MRAIIALVHFALALPIAARGGRWTSVQHKTVSTTAIGSQGGLATPSATGGSTGASSIPASSGVSPTDSDASAPSDSSSTSKNSTSSSSSSNGVSVPASCFKPNGVPVGWLPNDVDISSLQNKVKSGTKACNYGDFAHITSTSDYGDEVMGSSASKSARAGTVLTIALQPLIPFSQVDASKVAASMENVLSKGPEVVWLRFAHEMNWYISSNSKNTAGPTYYGTQEEFKTLWKNIAKAVDRAKVKMFWSPNGAVPPDTIVSIGDDWWPGDEYVDLVGMDGYPTSEKSFADVFGEFCDTYSTAKNLPFALGETGWLNGGADEQKKYWLGQVSSAAALERCPNYLGFNWFEYDKPSEGDFRVVGGSSNIAKDVLVSG